MTLSLVLTHSVVVQQVRRETSFSLVRRALSSSASPFTERWVYTLFSETTRQTYTHACVERYETGDRLMYRPPTVR